MGYDTRNKIHYPSTFHDLLYFPTLCVNSGFDLFCIIVLVKDQNDKKTLLIKYLVTIVYLSS